MLVRRGPVRYRRYSPFNPEMIIDEKVNFESPKEMDIAYDAAPDVNDYSGGPGNRSFGGFSFFNKIASKIGIEEILLLGVIFILLQERIEDEILLIILVYILLSGME